MKKPYKCALNDFQSLRKVAKKESPTKKHKTASKNSKKGSSSSKTDKWSTETGSSEPSTRYLTHLCLNIIVIFLVPQFQEYRRRLQKRKNRHSHCQARSKITRNSTQSGEWPLAKVSALSDAGESRPGAFPTR